MALPRKSPVAPIFSACYSAGLSLTSASEEWPACIAFGLTTLLSYPFVLAVLSKRIWLVMALQIPLSFFGIGVLHGLAPIVASESFPTKFRYSCAGVAYNLSGVLGGMIAPALLAGLTGQDVFYCAVAMLALLFIREREAALPITLRPQKAVSDQLSGGFSGRNS